MDFRHPSLVFINILPILVSSHQLLKELVILNILKNYVHLFVYVFGSYIISLLLYAIYLTLFTYNY